MSREDLLRAARYAIRRDPAPPGVDVERTAKALGFNSEGLVRLYLAAEDEAERLRAALAGIREMAEDEIDNGYVPRGSNLRQIEADARKALEVTHVP